MKIAVIGSGGREHAILRALARGSGRPTLYALPGNGGTGALATNIPVNLADTAALHTQLQRLRPDLTVVGPELPLAAGIADLLAGDGLACFGPRAAAARIESSKVFAKELMRDSGVPTAPFEVFAEFDRLEQYVRAHPETKWVVKADGLAAGKGAFVCDTVEETLAATHALLVVDLLGAAGRRVVLEQRMYGREASCMYWCDGQECRALPVAQDHKRAFDGDVGPNTGGMGAICPAPQWNESLDEAVEQTIIRPVLRGLAERGTPFVGILYAGLMLTERGPQVIEFNCRLGDPETQSILAVWPGDFAEHARACVEQRLGDLPRVPAARRTAITVVLAAGGYPDQYERGIALGRVDDADDCYTLHAGTSLQDGRVVSSGGRVLNAVGIGSTLSEARARALEVAERLAVPGLRYRQDIGQ